MNTQNNLKKQPSPYDFHLGLYKFLSGALIGCTNATLTTPLNNYINHVINQNSSASKDAIKFTCARAFDGLVSYNVSLILRVSIALSLNSLFIHELKQYVDVNETEKLLSSILAGGIAGAAASLPEAIAQTQQLSKTKPTPAAIIKTAYSCNGLFGLSRGMQATMVRSAGFTAGYLGLMPWFSQRIRQETGDHPIADVFSAIVCGSIVGLITTPPNALRFRMQQNFNEKGPATTYTQLIKETYKSSEGLRDLFAGIKPRTIMCMLSMFIIAEGNKLGNMYAQDGLPGMSGPRLK